MKWKGLIAILIIVGLLAGFICVPVARAAVVPITVDLSAMRVTVNSSTSVSFYAGTPAMIAGTGGGTSWAGDAGPFAITVDGAPAGNPARGFWNNNLQAVPPCGVYCNPSISSSAAHTVVLTWLAGSNAYYSWPSGSMTWNYLGGGVLIQPVSVSITGSATASIGVNTSFAAVIAGGTAPYSTTWHVDGTGGNEGVILTADNVSPAGLTVKFATISHYIVRATVVDATGGMASATYDVNLMSSKPVMHGQIIRAEAAESYTFNMYTDGVVLTEGVALASDCIPSAQYEVTSPTVIMQSEYGWQIWPVSPLPNPLYVYVTYHAPETGFVWSYRFTMDTSILTGAGTWTKSDGTGSDDGATLAPTWVDGLLNRLKIVLIDSSKAAFRWLFVPDAAQMALLMPQGTVQADGTLSKEGNIAASLLEGTTWGAGASEWKLTVHYATFTITLVDIDFTAMRSSAFVRGIRFAIQAVMSMSLVYLVVVLI